MRAEHTVTMRARPSAVWSIVGDPSNYLGLIQCMTRFDHLGRGKVDVGSRWRMLMRVGSVDVGGIVEIVEYEPNCELAWTNVLGLEQRGRWRLREVEPGVTSVTLRLSWQSPGGLWGLIADRVARPEVARILRSSLETLRAACEKDSPPEHTSGPSAATFLAQQMQTIRVLTAAGLITPQRPDRLIAAGLELRRWGLSLHGAYAASAVRYPDAVAIIDERGSQTFRELDERSSAIGSGLAASGISEGDRVAVMCRNHAGFVEATLALGKVGADILYLNTGFAGPQLCEVVEREGAAAIVLDEEFLDLVGDALPRSRRFLAWTDGRVKENTLDTLAAKGNGKEPVPPERQGRVTILTSGTTGPPKGASRSQPRNVDPVVAILSRIPLRARGTTLVSAPLFHSWGFAHFGFGALLSSTLVLQRAFDPEGVLDAVERHRVTAVAAVPVMLRRIVDLPAAARKRHDTSSLSVVAVSGSALSAELARRFMDTFGDIVYNLYGSTEVAYATIATPDELRRAPGTAGRPPFGTIVKLLDENGREVPPGGTGRIFVGNGMLFEGYTGGGSKEVAEGLMSTGDVGRFDSEGLLFIEGRGDDMIVSGGENVFPAEVEELLNRHADIEDVAVIGVPDEEWGQRLRAYVVTRGKARLSPDDVKAHVRSRLARYKVPREVEFVDTLPRNPAGKVMKRDLLERSEQHEQAEKPKARRQPATRRASAKRARKGAAR